MDFLLPSLWTTLVGVFLTSLCLCALIVVVGSRMPRTLGRRGDLVARQASHSKPTPRIGGTAVAAAVCIGLVATNSSWPPFFLYLVAAVSVLFIVGLLEDVGIGIAPKHRLLAAVLSAMILIALSGMWLPRIGIPLIDTLVATVVVGIPLTLVASAGVANGFNLIDGINGLAAFVSILTALALTFIAQQAGVPAVAAFSLIIAAAVAGFAVVNYPFGLIFLGDAGAYTIGFIFSWLGIAIVIAAPDVTPWAILLVMFWPIADTVYAMYRRASRQVEAMQPDRLHMHQLVMRGLEACFLGNKHRLLANSLSTVVLAPFIAAPALAGVMFWKQPLFAFGSVCIFAGLFVATYAMGPKLVRNLRRRNSRLAARRESGILVPGE